MTWSFAKPVSPSYVSSFLPKQWQVVRKCKVCQNHAQPPICSVKFPYLLSEFVSHTTPICGIDTWLQLLNRPCFLGEFLPSYGDSSCTSFAWHIPTTVELTGLLVTPNPADLRRQEGEEIQPENWLPYKSDVSEAHSAQDFFHIKNSPINAKSYLQTKILLFHTSPDSNSQLFCWPEVIEIAKWGCYVCHRYRPRVICIWSYRMTLTMSRLIPNDQMVDRCVGWLFNTCPSSTLQ